MATATDRLVNLTRLVDRGYLQLDLNELRWLIQYEGIPVYTDGRTRTRYLDAAGVRRVEQCAGKFKAGRARYFNAAIHPAFTEEKTNG